MRDGRKKSLVINPHPAYAGKHISRPDAAVMDAPLWCHYRKLALWVVLEGILIALSIVARTDHVSCLFLWI